MTQAKQLRTFRLSADNLALNDDIDDAYDRYADAISAYRSAQSGLKDAAMQLQCLLDGPLRSNGLVSSHEHWTFREGEDCLVVSVWNEDRRRGKRRFEPALKELQFGDSEQVR